MLPLFTVTAVVTTILAIFSSLQGDPKRCDGCFINPLYVRLQFQHSNPALSKRYSIFSVQLAHRRNSLQKLNGIPVIFIPGNAGNYKQARNFVSVSNRVFNWELQRHGNGQENNDVKCIDLFALETGYELSAFDPISLKYQALYLIEAIDYILNLYDSGINKPSQVVLIGHSVLYNFR